MEEEQTKYLFEILQYVHTIFTWGFVAEIAMGFLIVMNLFLLFALAKDWRFIRYVLKDKFNFVKGYLYYYLSEKYIFLKSYLYMMRRVLRKYFLYFLLFGTITGLIIFALIYLIKQGMEKGTLF